MQKIPPPQKIPQTKQNKTTKTQNKTKKRPRRGAPQHMGRRPPKICFLSFWDHVRNCKRSRGHPPTRRIWDSGGFTPESTGQGSGPPLGKNTHKKKIYSMFAYWFSEPGGAFAVFGPRDVTRATQKPAKTIKDGPRATQDHLRWPKSHPRALKMAQGAPKRPPGGLRTG